jgi:hypothetical protein
MGGEIKPLAKGRLFKLYFSHATSPSTIAPDIYLVKVVSIPTSYIAFIFYWHPLRHLTFENYTTYFVQVAYFSKITKKKFQESKNYKNYYCSET